MNIAVKMEDGPGANVVERESSRAKHIPGEAGIWLLIIGDLLMFSVFFLTFIYYRAQNLAVYTAGQQSLHQAYGLINTLLLLTSSWFVALAAQRVRGRRASTSRPLLLAGIACSVAFVGMKSLEYSEKIGAGLTVTTSEFYMFYFMFTGIHLIHVLIGTGVLIYMASICRHPVVTSNQVRTIESGASFWHLVDLLWIVLFPLLYLMK